MRAFIRAGIITFILAANFSTQVIAQTPTVEPGVIEREFREPPPPASTGAATPVAPLIPAAPANAAEIRFQLVDLVFEGDVSVAGVDLDQYARALEGREVSLADIYEASAEITRTYAERGYLLSVAIVPAQEIEDGRAVIRILEGYVASIEVTGDPGRARGLLERYGRKLIGVRPLTRAALERYLLLASDLPGLTVRGVFERGEAGDGGVKLVLDVDRQVFNASAEANNRGSRAIGRGRGSAFVGLNGAFWGGDEVGLQLVKSFDSRELVYFHGRAASVINAEGTKIAVSGGVTDSYPGTALLQSLDFNSDAWSLGLEVSHPIIRSRAVNLRLITSFEARNLESRFGDILNTRDKLRVARFGAVFDAVDSFGGANQISGFLSKGVGVFDATRESDLNKSRFDGDGSFVSFSGEAARRQPLGQSELVIAVGGQLASRQLLAAEECGYGGGAFGRGFDNYEIAGDQCVYGSAELRHSFAPAPDFRFQPYVFYDAGVIWQRGALLPGDKRKESGQSLGGGVRMRISDHIAAGIEYAKPLTRDVALEGDRDGRLFFTISAVR